MSLPAVSVVIPTYNQPAFLMEALNSVFGQTFTDYEIVIVNDGSTDDTVEQLKPYESRVRLINQENRGIGAARNRGIAEARGKYVALLDHDDLWYPRKLETQVTLLDSNADLIAATAPYAYSRSPDKCAFDAAAVANEANVIDHPLRKFAHNTFVTTSSLIFHRERAGGLEYGTKRGCIEDVQFYIGLFERGGFALAGREILAIYRTHDANFSGQASYHFCGVRLLRQMDRAGHFSCASREDRDDLNAYLAALGRVAAMQQILSGRRVSGAALYASEWFHQLCEGRLRFLLLYPAMLLAPRFLLRRRWRNGCSFR